MISERRSRFQGTRRGLAIAVISAMALFFGVANHASAAVWEPNDNVTQAVGPLVGGTNLVGAIDTANDVDYYYFYTSGQVQFNMEFINLTPDEGCLSVDFRRGDNNDSIKEVELYGDEIFNYAWTSPGPRKYFIVVGDDSWCSGDLVSYRIRIDPAEALTVNPPPALTTPECDAATAAAFSAGAAVKKAVAKLKRTRGWRNKRRQARKVSRLRSSYRTQLARANEICQRPLDY